MSINETEPQQRAVMTSAELAGHKVTSYGRDYSESDDGYSDMEAEQRRGWHPVPGWGRDGWDLGNWPYVVIYTRTSNPGTISGGKLVRTYELMQICEGDRTVYAFASEQDRTAATDYLFLWYSADEDWSPVTWQTREQLDKGEIAVDPKFRGPFSWKRAEATGLG